MQELAEKGVETDEVKIETNELQYFQLRLIVLFRFNRLLDEHAQVPQPWWVDLFIFHWYEQAAYHPVLVRHLLVNDQTECLFS
jgi:hypothetical protein